MTENRISGRLTGDDLNAVLTAIQTIKSRMPFLQSVGSEELKRLPKIGDKGLAFVKKALELAAQSDDFLPRSFDVQEMKNDVDLYEALLPIRIALAQLTEMVDETAALVGSEAYAAGLVVYNSAKMSGKGAGLEGVLDELGKRFARKSGPKDDAPGGGA
jgi:hypothetical protein